MQVDPIEGGALRDEHCACHGWPWWWCPDLASQHVATVPLTTLDGMVHEVCPAPVDGLCGICGRGYEAAETVAVLPAPTWGYPYAHERCPA